MSAESTPRESKAFKIFTAIFTVQSFLVFGIVRLSDVFVADENEVAVSLVVVFIIIFLQVLLLVVRKTKFVQIISRPLIRFFQDPRVGKYNINISYIDKNSNSEVHRSGVCEIVQTVVGLKIYGEKVYDSTTKAIEVERWVADNADLLSYDNDTILCYNYRIYSSDPSTPSKLGIVTAKLEPDFSFHGRFKDLSVANGKTVRKGDVKLWRA